MGHDLPLVSIVTVNYNGKLFLKDLFDSLKGLDYPKERIEVIMVDNGSRDGSLEYVRDTYPEVIVVQNQINNYCLANNLGIKLAKGDYVSLVNNDVTVDKQWLSALIRYMQEDGCIGAVGSKILFSDGAIQSLGHQEYPNFYWEDIGFNQKDGGQFDGIKEVVSICGCSVLYKMECLKDVGLLDEDFNMFMEDVDMAIRCKKKGWRLLTCPQSILYHKFHGTIGSQENATHWQETNRLLLIAKHWPDKLSAALSGKDYFTVKNGYDNPKDISETLGKVFAKLLKEHGSAVLNNLSTGIFESVRGIYNSEKDYLIQSLINAQQENSNLTDNLNEARKENLKLGQDLQKEQESSFFKQQELISKESELSNYKLSLQLIKKELNEIYSSTGYRYFLRPVWDFLWPLKQRIKRAKIRIRFFLGNSGTEINKIYYLPPSQSKWADVYTNHIKYKTFPPKPERLNLMLNRICDLKYTFCDIPNTIDKEDALSKENAFKIIAAAGKLGIKEMILTGGEPFLHPYLFEIIDFANSRNINSMITTNGLFVKQHIHKIIKSDINCISVSIDGKEKTHDLLRGRQGAYKQALEAIHLLRENKINTSVNFVVTNKNINELEDIYSLFSELGVKVSFLPVINKPDLFFTKKEEKNTYMKFIKKLLHKKAISIPEYRYLKAALSVYFDKEKVKVRCAGLNYELGVDTDGNIAPCCVWENRKPELNNLGNALETDMEELWYSLKFQQARASIFNEGCQNCFNPSVSELPKIAGIDFLSPALKRQRTKLDKPNHVHMRFTSSCNLSCRHCDIWKIDKSAKREISTEDWKRCIDKLHTWLGSFKLDLAGGEILLYHGAIPLIQHCAGKGITVNLTTNSMLIDEVMAEKIADSGLRCINLSLDGLEDVHCYTRNNPDAFLRVHRAAQNLLKYRKRGIPYISLSTVITKNNLKQLAGIINLIKEWGIDNVSFQALDQNFSAKYDDSWFKNNEFWPIDFSEAEETIEGLIRMKKKGIRIGNSIRQLNAIKRYYRNPDRETNNQCFTGINNFIVNESGDVLLCWNMPAVGNLLSDNPEQIWNSESASQMRKQIERCKRTCRILNCNYA